MASMFIIIGALQFWINDYMEKVLEIEDKNKRLYVFTSVYITSPVFGIIIGGMISGKIGGYDTEKAIYIPLLSSLMVSIIANIVPLAKSLTSFTILFWLYLFFGSIIVPVCSGLVLCSVEKQYSGSAATINTLVYNVLGKLIGPNFYGYLKDKVGDEKSVIPFWCLLNIAVPGFFAVLLGVKFQKEKYRNLREKALENQPGQLEMAGRKINDKFYE